LAALPGCQVEVEILDRKRDRGRFMANPVLAHLEENWSRPKPFENRSDVSHADPEPTPNPSQEGNWHDADECLLPSPPSRHAIAPLRRGGGWEASGVGRFMDKSDGCPGLPDALRVAVCPNPDA